MKVLLHTMYDTVLTCGNLLGDPIWERALKHEAAEALCGDDYQTQNLFPFYAVAFGARIAVKAIEATDDHLVAFGPPQWPERICVVQRDFNGAPRFSLAATTIPQNERWNMNLTSLTS